MTYVAAFRCREGFVCCADTQETFGDNKQYVEKLEAFGDGEYPFVLGGAGNGDLVDALAQEISDRLLKQKPECGADLKNCVQGALAEVYAHDVPYMTIQKDSLGTQLLIAVNVSSSDSDFQLVKTHNKRAFLIEGGKAIIGYPTAANKSLLDRFHKPTIRMAHAVTLAALLVSQSKYLDAYVGGLTSLGIVTQFRSLIEDKEYIQMLEQRASDCQPIVDDMFLYLTDAGMSKDEFEKSLATFVELLRLQRQIHLDQAGQHAAKMMADGTFFRPWPYAKFPLGGSIKFMEDGTMVVSDDKSDVPEHILKDASRMKAELEKADAARRSASRSSVDQP